MLKTAVGIDIGGTNIKFGLVDQNGGILKQERLPVGGDRSPRGIIKLIKEIVAPHRTTLLGVGIGAPGIVDFGKGTIIRSPHYPDWSDFALRGELSSLIKLPVLLDNDANTIAAGELWMGAGRGVKNFIMITLGTGIGGGIVINGEIFHGDGGFAGEIGHLVIKFDGGRCDCGGRGCWENYVSIEGLRRLILDSDDPRRDAFLERFGGCAEKIEPKDLFELAGEGDIFASAVWKKFGAYFGAGIASLANITGIFTFVIGGGIANAWDFFIGEGKNELARRTYKETAGRILIKRAELSDAAGIIGAAGLVFNSAGWKNP